MDAQDEQIRYPPAGFSGSHRCRCDLVRYRVPRRLIQGTDDPLQCIFNSLSPGDVPGLSNDTYNVQDLYIKVSGTARPPITIRGLHARASCCAQQGMSGQLQQGALKGVRRDREYHR